MPFLSGGGGNRLDSFHVSRERCLWLCTHQVLLAEAYFSSDHVDNLGWGVKRTDEKSFNDSQLVTKT